LAAYPNIASLIPLGAQAKSVLFGFFKLYQPVTQNSKLNNIPPQAKFILQHFWLFFCS
jgi:hypothetical protein